MTLFKQKPFLFFFLAQFISRFGDGITTTIVLYIIGTLSKDPFFIGLVLLAQYSPTLLLGFFTGTIADRFPKNYIMIGADLYRALVMVMMTFSTHSVWLLIILVLLSGIGNAIYYPARSSFIPHLVGEQHITQALSISQIINSIMQIAGSGVAGILLVLTSPSNILMIDAITFLFSAFFTGISVKLIKYKQTIKKNTQPNLSIWNSTKEGIKIVFNLSPLTFLIVLIIQIMFAAGIFNTTSTSLMLQVFNVSSYHYGMIEAMLGVGAFLGAAMGPFLLSHFKPGYLLFFSTILMGIWMILVIPLHQFPNIYVIPALYVWVSIIGLINSFLNIPISSLFLGLTPENYRGRAMAILQMASYTGLLLGIVISGILSKFYGSISVTAISGSLLVIISIITVKTKGFKELLTIDKKVSRKKKNSVLVSGMEQ
ncbi:MFS transporter [Thermaerobacillus caldiproteolyticus]|uniref:MFS transporter n=1 Tax=Thermaerobacillus caldiproteolyticus TaxID=247480 RepID=UPI00280A511A|nr:MFS transporter [Anoxybacillus caldiproteolyticus]